MPDLSETSPPRPGAPAGGQADWVALIQALGRPFSAVTSRSAPVRARVLKNTVERILTAGRGLGLSLGLPPALQAVAERAGVTLSAAFAVPYANNGSEGASRLSVMFRRFTGCFRSLLGRQARRRRRFRHCYRTDAMPVSLPGHPGRGRA